MILSGTGHRPLTLGLDYSEKSEELLQLFCKKILLNIQKTEDISQIYSGGATGWDLALAYTSINMGFATTLALPFYGFGSNWPIEQQRKFWKLMEKCTVVYVSEQDYTGKWQYIKRDHYLVDHCDRVLALHNGTPSTGTGLTVAYAEKKSKPVQNVWELWEKFRKF